MNEDISEINAGGDMISGVNDVVNSVNGVSNMELLANQEMIIDIISGANTAMLTDDADALERTLKPYLNANEFDLNSDHGDTRVNRGYELSLLQQAVESRAPKCFARLIELGADVNHPNSIGWLPSTYAFLKGILGSPSPECTSIIHHSIESGMDIRSMTGKSPNKTGKSNKTGKPYQHKIDPVVVGELSKKPFSKFLRHYCSVPHENIELAKSLEFVIQ